MGFNQSWEAKLAQSRVADFSSDARLGAYQRMLPPLEESVKDTSVLANGNSGKTDGLGAHVKDEVRFTAIPTHLPDH